MSSKKAWRAQYVLDFNNIPAKHVTKTEEVTKLHVKSPLGEVVEILSANARNVCEAFGIPVFETVTKETKHEEDRRYFSDDLYKLSKDMNGKDGLCNYNWYNTVVVETRFDLPQSAHMRRRLAVEQFLKFHAIPYTLECAAVLSENVCKPITLENES